MIRLMRELGIDASWEVIFGPAEFHQVTKAFHQWSTTSGCSATPALFVLEFERKVACRVTNVW
jgi:hypothetical protein